MKNIRFIALIALMLGGMTMKAQEYHPIVEDGKQWNVLFSYPWSPPEPPHRYTDIYKIEGDTLLDGVSYKMMYATRNEDLTGWNLWGFIRETENGQVFSRRPSTSDEQLLYDFSMEVGDTICMCDYGYDECCMVVIEKGETIVNGEPRQQIVLEYPWGGGDGEVWIEGIGSLYGIIDSGSHFLTGGSTNLLCYYEDGDLIWQNTSLGYDVCYFVYSGGGQQSGLVVTPTVLIFDEPAVPQTFTISNQFDNDVTITSIYVQPDDNTVLVSHTDLPQTLQPNESMDVEVELNAIGNKGYNTYHIYMLTSEGAKVVVVRVNENAWNVRFPLENTAWVQFYRSMYEDSTYYQLGINGDTVVNETTYKKVINCTHLGYPIEGECFGGIREDADGKCYFMSFVPGIYAPWPLHYDCEVNTEYPLYDFSLSVCDVFPTIGLTPHVVFDTTSMQLNGSTRRVLWLGNNCDSGNPYEWQWVEGIGSTHSLLFPIQCEPDNGPEYRLVEVWQDEEMIYRNPIFDDYVPLIQEDKNQQWNVVNIIAVSAYPDVYHTDIQFIEGDSIIDGVVYRQAWVKGPNDNEPRLDGFVREEDKRVYYRKQSYFGLEEEVLLYDFNLMVGDTVTVNGLPEPLMVLEESEVEMDGVMRRQLGLGYPCSIPELGEIDEYWIEGVGSTHGLLNSGYEPWSWFGSFVHLLCYYENGNLIWDNEAFDDCMMNSDEEPFAVGDLLYSIISTDPPHVNVVGHVDGENAQGELDIPNVVTYEGVTYTVTEIGEWAFKNCAGLTGELAIPSTIDTIQQGAFYGCSGFTGTLDFSFSTVVFKENVFRECSGFTELILPLFISEIPQGLFCGCSGLTGTLVLPETVEIIGEGAFARCSGFTGLVLPNGLREIREQAFSGCTGFMGSLVFPETLTHIKYQAFSRCAGFSGDLVIPDSVVELGNTQNTGYYVNPEPTSTFADCFDHIVLSQSLDTIGPRCFWGCTRLTGDLVIPEGVKAIFAYAFSECSGFTSLTLNESLDYIGAYAFNACTGLTGSLSIPESVEVGSYAFADCIGIEELVLPHDFTVVNYELSDIGYVFDGCSGLTELTIPEGWTTIVKSEFSRCGNLTHVSLPESLTKIETNAFKECTNLEAINLPEGVTEIGNGAFARCRNFAHIELPTGLRTLGGQAFSRCTSLTGEIVIPDLVQRIELMTFDSCYMLQSVVFGDSINYITEPAFENTELSSLVLKAMTPPQLQRMSSPNAWHFPADIPIIVPCGTLEAYQNDENWGSFTNITEDCGNGLIEFHGSEWYYEIVDEFGNITYQHLEYTADTTVNHKDVQIIIRTNTLYDKGEHQEVTREYLYLEDEVVYWWNKDLQEFTVLYDLGAQPGDSWVIKVGTETLTMHVDAVNQNYYEGQLFRMMQVSDEGDLFSGTIVCGVGHLSSFFPERLMTSSKGYRVQGLRCYWNYGNLLFTINRDDCDAIYANLHNGLDEPTESVFSIYPNPTHNVLFVETRFIASHPTQTYRITNLTGQIVLTGTIDAETQQIDVSNLPVGMYFITFAGETRKFVVNQ